MSRSIVTLFHCPACEAKYEVVGFEATPGPTTDGEVACICYGGPIPARDGTFLFKYSLIEPPSRCA